ncbi:MAG TPA: protein kinase [Gemmatimonadaceae bacterium]|nr:protein kinase [Gemmatimonadaceae bacterium]
MDPVTRERWQRIDALLDAALELPVEERDVFLRDACGDDEELRAQVQRLIASGERPGDTFALPAAELVMAILPSAGVVRSHDVPERIGAYRILSEIGRGGMGVVYLAEREEFRQTVALKVVRRGLDLEPGLVRRFLAEREILASLEHPHIARLLDGGVTEDGLPYFAMEYVQGEPIDRYCDRRQLDVEHRIRLMGQACSAVAYAHGRSVVHRDLKPSNILVTDGGSVKLLDFGIAKLLDAERVRGETLTHTGMRLLTPEYASPEQIRAEPVTPATDVYSLGVLLYELLTGRSPHLLRGREPRAIERAILEETPRRPSSIIEHDGTDEPLPDDPDVGVAGRSRRDVASLRGTDLPRLRRRLRGDLDAIVLQALRKEPERRYASAAAFAGDLERHLAGRPVAARPDAWTYRAGKFGQRHRWSIATGMAGIVVGIGVLTLALPRAQAPPAGNAVPSRPSPQVFAIGGIVDHRESPVAELARPLADMLATNLGRTPGLRVVSTARMYELMRQAGDARAASPDAIMAAARRAGATVLVDGALYETPAGQLRLDVRVIELANGTMLHSESVTGADAFAIADSGTARLVPRLGARAPGGSLADVTTRSFAAYRFYEEGLRAFIAGEQAASYRLFDAALREDSTFALAAYYAGRSAPTFAGRWRAYARAVRLAGGATDRERLRIQTGWAASTFSPSARVLAETLTARYPDEIEGQYFAGAIAVMEGRYAAALPYLRRVVAMDSLGLRAAGTQCDAACQALTEIISAYGLMDSLALVERELRRWIDIQPAASAPWIRLSAVLDQQGRPDEALAAYREFASLAPQFADGSTYMAQHRIWERRYDEAARLLRDVRQTGTERQRAEAAWYLAIALRQQGLLAEALAAARMYRRASFDDHTESAAPPAALMEGQVLFEAGRYAQAAALFDSIALVIGPPEAPASVRAKARAWALTHAATARAAMGDTASLAALADTVAVLGGLSALQRDRLLHHYVRGLLLTSRGQLDAAAAEHRRAMSSRGMGYTRVNLELARLLLRLGRPREAVGVLQPALRGGLEASNLYVTRTELYAVLGEAWEAAGRADSATAHYRAVVRDWRRAEAPFAEQRARVTRRLAAIEERRP